MIDEIRGAGNPEAGRARSVFPGGTPPGIREDAAGGEGAAPLPETPAFRNRLAGAAGRLDALLEELSRLQAREESAEGPDARSLLSLRRAELERSISAAQVGIQNIISTEGTAEPVAPPDMPPGHDLDRQNILQLLER